MQSILNDKYNQEKETRRHQGTLDKLAEELGSLQSRAAETSVIIILVFLLSS